MRKDPKAKQKTAVFATNETSAVASSFWRLQRCIGNDPFQNIYPVATFCVSL